MKLIKRFALVELDYRKNQYSQNYELVMDLGSNPYPETFETEEEALTYLYTTGECKNWTIIPVITFD